MLRHPRKLLAPTFYAAILILHFACVGSVAQDAAADPTQSKPSAQTGAACQVAPRPNALYSLAGCCSRDLKSNRGCEVYDAQDAYIILKDNAPTKPESYMIIPTAKVTGIDDKQVFDPPVVNFFQYGWTRAATYPGKPAVNTALAINSVHARTENQLHIHMSCVRPDVDKVLQDNDSKIRSYPAKFRKLKLPPNGNTYQTLRVASLGGNNSPFLVIQKIRGVKGHMGQQSIALVGTERSGEYYLLATRFKKGDPQSGGAEELMDEACTGVNPAATPQDNSAHLPRFGSGDSRPK